MNISSELLIASCITQILGFLYLNRMCWKRIFKASINLDKWYREQISMFEKKQTQSFIECRKSWENQVNGIIKQARIKGKVSEKLAENAFRLANAATLGLMHLQKTLAVRPVYVPRKKLVENEKIQKDVMNTLGGSADYSDFDFLYTVLGEEERELVDKAMEHASKYNGNAPESPKEG